VKKPFSKMSLRVVKEDGKARIEVQGSDACVLCEKTVLRVSDCLPVEVAVAGKQVSLSCKDSSLKMKADHVTTAPKGYLLLEGNVHVEGAGSTNLKVHVEGARSMNRIDIQGRKVHIKLPCEILPTFVPSSPTLVQ